MMTSANNVGEGWHPILRTLEEELNAIDPNFTLQQVKEKFGGLRYYASLSEAIYTENKDWDFQFCLRKAEELSCHTCEECGKPAETKAYRGWYKTLCDEHGAARQAQIDQELDELHTNHGGES